MPYYELRRIAFALPSFDSSGVTLAAQAVCDGRYLAGDLWRWLSWTAEWVAVTAWRNDTVLACQRNIAVDAASTQCQVGSSLARPLSAPIASILSVYSQPIRLFTYFIFVVGLIFFVRLLRLRSASGDHHQVHLPSTWRHTTCARKPGDVACCVVSAVPEVSRDHRVSILASFIHGELIVKFSSLIYCLSFKAKPRWQLH